MKASKYVKGKVVNVINQKWNADGSVDVIIYKQGWKKAYRYTAKNLNMKNEEVIYDEEITEEVV